MSKKDEIFLGMAIGDGCITKHGSLQIKHSIIQQDYVLYKKQVLQRAGIKMIKDYYGTARETGYEGAKDYYRITTSCTDYGKKMRKYLYPNGIKIIPDDLKITPLMWSFIYQDDGRQNASTHYTAHRKSGNERIDVLWVNRYTIYTDCFDKKSIENLQKSLLENGIESSVNFSNKNSYPHIHIYRKDSKEKFKKMVEPYIHESMKYKIDLPTSIVFEN